MQKYKITVSLDDDRAKNIVRIRDDIKSKKLDVDEWSDFVYLALVIFHEMLENKVTPKDYNRFIKEFFPKKYSDA